AELKHDTMTMAIGYPAVVNHDDKFPELHVSALRDGQLQVVVTVDQAQVVNTVEIPMQAGAKAVIDLLPEQTLGTYKLQIKYTSADHTPYYDAFYFTVQEPAKIPANASKAAY